MSLHPQAKNFLEMVEALNLPPIEELDIEMSRQGFIQQYQQLSKKVDIYQTEDRILEGLDHSLTVRIYRPNELENLPVFVFFHGGGWVIGNIDSHDGLCRTFANEAQCVVVSVDYGLAPENKFPKPIEECYYATKWVADHADELGVDASLLAVGGDSAGGNLAAVVSYLAVIRKGPTIHAQYLFYPSAGFVETESIEKYGVGFGLDKSTMFWFTEQYLNDTSETMDPLAAPLLIPEKETKALPSAYIVTAECDPLCDGGQLYAEKLQRAGVDTTYICYPGMIHGFMCLPGVIEDGDRAVKESARHFKDKVATHQKS